MFASSYNTLPLHAAIRDKNTEMVDLLLRYGASTTMKPYDGKVDAYKLAAGNPEIEAVLAKHREGQKTEIKVPEKLDFAAIVDEVTMLEQEMDDSFGDTFWRTDDCTALSFIEQMYHRSSTGHSEALLRYARWSILSKILGVVNSTPKRASAEDVDKLLTETLAVKSAADAPKEETKPCRRRKKAA